MMWILIFLAILILSLTGFAFVVKRLTEFPFLRRLPPRKAYLFSFLILAVVLTAVSLWSGIWNGMIVFIHLLLLWLICEGIFRLAAVLLKKPFVGYRAGIAAVCVTICYLAAGFYAVHHVWRTAYTFETEQSLGLPSLRIVGFSDSHVGTTFHADRFNEFVAQMNAEQPDLVVIVGDFVDDSTGYADMAESCRALGQLKTKYGVYYVFGNHDKGYYGNHRGYGEEELIKNLQENNVTVLQDDVVPITANAVLCGRQDAERKSRMSMEELTGNFGDDIFSIVLDHQPNDYAAQAAAGAGLVISGHTHGGQFFPIIHAGEWISANDMTYGTKQIGQTRFIVSSGISNWAFRFKTGCISEYFVIDLIEKQ